MKKYITEPNQINYEKAGQYVLTTKDKKKVLKVITVTGRDSLVDQSQTGLTDVKKLLEPAIAKGLLRHATTYSDQYDDIPAITYQDALNTVAKADEMFQQLPSSTRNRFSNNPREFLEFTSNPANAEEMQKLGLLKGNDGLTQTGAPSGAPTPTDKNGDGITDTPIDTPTV